MSKAAHVPPTTAATPPSVPLRQLMAAPPRRERARHAWELPHATRFSDDRNFRNPVWLINEIKRQKQLWGALEKGTTEPHTYEKRKTGRKHVVGRNRLDGHWLLVGCAWIISKQTDIEAFYDFNQSSRLWDAAGFDPDKLPKRSTVYERLNELGEYLPAITLARQKLWHLAMHRDERVGRHIHVDATAVESHSRLTHACPDSKWCKTNGGKRMPGWIDRMDVGNANTSRQEENRLAPGEHVASEAPTEYRASDEADIEELILDQLEEEAEQPRHPKYGRRRKAKRRMASTGPKEIWIAKTEGGPKHRYECRDPEAGFRIYKDPRTGKKLKGWNGYLKLRAVDDYTGAEIASVHFAADEAEWQHFRELIERVREILGVYPEVVCTDRGHNVAAVRRACLELGIGFVGPFRKPNPQIKTRSQMRREGVVDEYGFCYCQHCDSPGTRHRYERRGARRYISFVCANPHTPACRRKRQFWDCDEAPLLANVLHKEEELYWELRRAGRPQERVHRVARARYQTGANNLDTRPKRLGLDFLELRSSLSHLVEVFRLCIRQGWLGDYAKARPFKPRRRPGGKRGLEILARLRRISGLLLPQGPKALALGFAWDGVIPDGWTPIQERRRKARAGESDEPPPGDSDGEPPF